MSEDIQEYDDLALYSDEDIVKALTANLGTVSRTAKALNVNPSVLYKRIKAGKNLRLMAKKELGVRLGLMQDQALSVLEKSLKNGSIKAATFLLRATGRFTLLRDEEDTPYDDPQKPGDSDNPAIEAPKDDTIPSVVDWKQKLAKAKKTEDGVIILDDDEETG